MKKLLNVGSDIIVLEHRIKKTGLWKTSGKLFQGIDDVIEGIKLKIPIVPVDMTTINKRIIGKTKFIPNRKLICKN